MVASKREFLQLARGRTESEYASGPKRPRANCVASCGTCCRLQIEGWPLMKKEAQLIAHRSVGSASRPEERSTFSVSEEPIGASCAVLGHLPSSLLIRPAIAPKNDAARGRRPRRVKTVVPRFTTSPTRGAGRAPCERAGNARFLGSKKRQVGASQEPSASRMRYMALWGATPARLSARWYTGDLGHVEIQPPIRCAESYGTMHDVRKIVSGRRHTASACRGACGTAQ